MNWIETAAATRTQQHQLFYTQFKKKEQEIDERAARVIKLTKEMLNFCGFELIERVQIRHKQTGREYK